MRRGRAIASVVVVGAVVAVFLVINGPLVLDPLDWTASAWEALGVWATCAVALAAAVVGLRQYVATSEANRLQADASRSQIEAAERLATEESRPYVVAYIESHPRNPQFIDLVVKNFGKTPAHYTSLTIEPRPRRSSANGGGDEPVVLPDSWPFLAPGQEWRTLWDYSIARAKTDLPSKHRAVVRSKDSSDHDLPDVVSFLDWNSFTQRRWISTRTTHDAASALMEIKKILGKWTEDLHGGLAVFTRDGAAKDAQDRAAYDEHVALLEELDQSAPLPDALVQELEAGDAPSPPDPGPRLE
jgi:hypothetical protein